jgi:DNA polymerase III subunit delta'
MVDEIAASSTPAPRANPDLFGHESAEKEFLRLHRAGRLPHAILLSGRRGIGKATFAFRLARFLLSETAGRPPGMLGGSAGEGLAIGPENSVFRRVASGGHADLLTVERAYDPRRRRLRSEIVVDDVREIAAFFRLTAAEEGWRIAIVDAAEDMNRNAANALLKILEEPPRRALLLLVSHSPGRLLPTVRSRCRRFPLSALAHPLMMRLLEQYRPGLARSEADGLAKLSGGSIGRAIELADAGGLELYRSVLKMLSPPADMAELHSFADKFARPDADDAYQVIQELLSTFLARVIMRQARGAVGDDDLIFGEREAIERLSRRADPARWATLRTGLELGFDETDLLNLDRKQALLGAFFAIEEAAR